MSRMLDLFCGRFGWGRAFAARGWEVVGIDLVEPPEIPDGCRYIKGDVLALRYSDAFQFNRWFLVENGERRFIGDFDFVCGSSPCEQFSCFTMKMWQPNPKPPELGLRLFRHAERVCLAAGVPYILENVRGAVRFLGAPAGCTGAFCLWGNAVPPILPSGLTKSKWFKRPGKPGNICAEALKGKRERKAILATIPPELASCVADYAARILK